jgi:hypothetical protein
LPAKIGDILTPSQYAEVEELGMLVDKDDQVPFDSLFCGWGVMAVGMVVVDVVVLSTL